MEYTTHSEKETFDLGRKIAKNMQGGAVIGLVGDLGAGKTIFTKGLAAGLGIKQNITSPTFVLMKIYPVNCALRPGHGPGFNRVNPVPKQIKKIKNFCHIDAYRIKSAEDIAAIGAEEYFSRADTVSVVEWADKIKKILPKKTRFINIKTIQEGQRKIITK